jgi:hypothetical protein
MLTFEPVCGRGTRHSGAAELSVSHLVLSEQSIHSAHPVITLPKDNTR